MTERRFSWARRSVLLAMLALVLVTTALPRAASAHARLLKSQPPARASLDVPPAEVRLWFNERLEPDFARIAVTNEKGEPVTKTPARVASDDPKVLVLELSPLPAGTYTVTVEVLSVDGHRVKQSFPFTVKAGSTGK
ncbi:MAG: copper resistance CopC family protein [Candidatus Binatia bacterium]